MVDVIKKYFFVTKPGIVFGNLITATGGFLFASKGHIEIAALLMTVIGISLVVASGCVLNNCVDRKMDRKMERTRKRVLAQGRMSPKAAVFYSLLLCMAGILMLWAATNVLSVGIVLAGLGIYVGLYSLYLKRHSIYGSLVGSLAGAAPPLAGYCAVRSHLDMQALILLSIFSLWQMPHCYTIAIFRFQDYRAAALPVMPVKQGIPAAKRHIVGYILAFMVASLMLTFGGYTGYLYLAVMAVMGLSWLHLARSGYRTPDDRLWAKKLLVFSLLNIFVLSIMMSIDFTVPATSDLLLTYAP
ncbi:MAG: heme o synthase [Desulfobacterales bacterium]|jgi:protoheme IX farnesyltransferase